MFDSQSSLEDNVLCLLATSDQHAATLAIRLKSEWFSSQAYRKIAAAALEYISRYRRAPGAHLRDLLEQQTRRGDEGKLMLRVLAAIDDLAPKLQPDFVMQELERFIEFRKFASAMDRASDALMDGDLTKARTLLWEATPTEDTKEGIWLHDPDAMMRFMVDNEEDYFPLGIDALDSRGVHPTRKTLTMFIAPPKRGKSWFLIHVGKSALLNKRSVLHITLENSEELTAQRYIQSLFAMTKHQTKTIRVPVMKRDSLGRFVRWDFDEITSTALTPSNRASLVRKLRSLKRRPPLLIKEFPTGTLTITQLNLYLDALEKNHNFKPDLLIVDYPDLMATDSSKLRVDLGVIFKNLRGVVVQRNMAGVVVTQGNRASADSKVVRSTMVAEDYSKIATADTVLTYSQTPAEKRHGIARLMVDASRSEEDKFVVMISQSYASGQFCLDSTYMSKAVEEDSQRMTGEGDDAEDAKD